MPDVQLQEEEIAEDSELHLLLRRFLQSRGQQNIEKNLREVLNEQGGFVERFTFFVPYLDEAAKEELLISGCSAGSEFLVSRKYGFRKILGTEVSPELAEICRLRFGGSTEFHVELINGSVLPFADERFSMVYSGHVIEHTPQPKDYFREHLRVLKTGGFFFLEFPHRYHSTELHTGLRSFEWAPLPFRNLLLRIAGGRYSPVSAEQKRLYDLVRRTLRPVSLWQIRLYLRLYGKASSRIVAVERPAPGFLRVLLQK